MQIGWVDFSKADREKVLDVINMLQVRGAVDELGIGQVRDAFANHFFPGTSTVQTRAKYFLIVPYILQEAVTGKYGSDVSKILQRIDQEEKKCGQLLFQKAKDEGRDPTGVGIIGARLLPDKWVARKPSNIYWSGIRTYHIFKQENMSIPNMIRLSVLMRAQAKPNTLGNYKDGAREGEEDDRDAGYNETISFFDVPEMPESDWRDSLNISLTPNEAVFLRVKIEQSVPDTLLAYILKQHIDVSKFDSFEQLYAALKNDVSAEMKGMMKLACDFSRLVYAAYVRYNMMLSRGQNKEAVSEWEKITDHMTAYTGVDLDAVLSFFDEA